MGESKSPARSALEWKHKMYEPKEVQLGSEWRLMASTSMHLIIKPVKFDELLESHATWLLRCWCGISSADSSS